MTQDKKPTCKCCGLWWSWSMPGRRDGCHLWAIFGKDRKDYVFFRRARRFGNRVLQIQQIIRREYFSYEMKIVNEKWDRAVREA